MPSAFTPNGDGVNDVLIVAAPVVKTLDCFRVYDRWGRLVFSTTDLRVPWDGTLYGKPAPGGAYVWMIRATDAGGRTITQRGTFTLIR